MFRKSTIALAALATIGAAALAPTTASAGYWHHGHGHHYNSFRHYAPAYTYNSYGCFKDKWVKGYYGWRVVRVNVCGY
jgi:hypothetical protein